MAFALIPGCGQHAPPFHGVDAGDAGGFADGGDAGDLTDGGDAGDLPDGGDAGDAGGALADGGFQFDLAASVNLSDAPSLVASADLNGDGRADLVVLYGVPNSLITNAESHALRVFLGNGDGTFVPGVRLDTGDAPQGIAIADFNGDGIPDLAVSVCSDDAASAHLLVFPGDGDGGFGAALSTSVSVCPFSLAVADFDGDGTPDLATAGPGPFILTPTYPAGEIRVYTTPAKALELHASLSLPTAAWGIVAADFDNDGKTDLAISLSSAELAIMLGNGQGHFAAPVMAPLAFGGDIFLAAGDVDGDGLPELVTASTNDSAVAVLFNHSTVGTVQFDAPSYFPGGKGPAALAMASLGTPGLDDVLVANISGFYNGVTYLEHQSPIQLVEQALFTNGAPCFGVTAADFDGDGRIDVAATDPIDKLLNVYLNHLTQGASDGGPFVPAPHPLPAAVPNKGGPILASAQVVVVTYDDDPQRASDETFAQWMVTSAWSASLSEYEVGTGTTLNVHLPGNAPTVVHESALRTLIDQLAFDGGAPSQVFLMYFPAQTTVIDDANGASCANYVSEYGTYKPADYAILPDCGDVATAEVGASLALVFAATDPHYNAWVTANKLELGDLCLDFQAIEGPYQVTRVWSNSAAAAGQHPCVPAPSEPYVTVTPIIDESVMVPAGQTVTVVVIGSSTAPTQPFAVSASPYPYDGYVYNFSAPAPSFVPAVGLDRALLSNGQTATLSIGVPYGTPSGSAGAVTLRAGLSDDNFSYWLMTVLVE